MFGGPIRSWSARRNQSYSSPLMQIPQPLIQQIASKHFVTTNIRITQAIGRPSVRPRHDGRISSA
eukprot:5351372-Prymnesium_polylepis.1